MTMLPAPTITVLPDGQRWVAECACGWLRLTDDGTAAIDLSELHAPQCHLHRKWATEQVDALPHTLGCYIPSPLRDLLDQLLGDQRSLPVLMAWLGELLDEDDEE